MDDLDQVSELIGKIERRARVIHACWCLFLIAAFLLNMYCFLFCDSVTNGIAGILVFICICYALMKGKLRKIGQNK